MAFAVLVLFTVVSFFTGFKWAYTPMEFIGSQGCEVINLALITALLYRLQYKFAALYSLLLFSLSSYEFYQEVQHQNTVLSSWEFIRLYMAYTLFVLIVLYHIVKSKQTN